MEIRKVSKYSYITFVNSNGLFDMVCTPVKIIQVVCENDWFLVEYIKQEDLEKYLDEKPTSTSITTIKEEKSEDTKELENALDTTLLNDPQGKYSGLTLREIFDKRDEDWLQWTLKNMHNQFILDRVKIIMKSGYGR